MKRLDVIFAACALLGTATAANASSYVVTLDQVGANVVATGSGQIDLTGLTSSQNAIVGSQIDPLSPDIFTGAGLSSAAGDARLYTGTISDRPTTEAAILAMLTLGAVTTSAL
jgi:hypothetical protein